MTRSPTPAASALRLASATDASSESMPSTRSNGNARASAMLDQPTPQPTSSTRAGAASQHRVQVRDRGQPGLRELVGERRPVEAALAVAHVVAVAAEADPRAVSERLEHGGQHGAGPAGEQRDRCDVQRALLVGQPHGMPGGQRVAARVRVLGRRVHGEKAGDGLLLEPLPGVAGVDAGPLGELTGRRRVVERDRGRTRVRPCASGCLCSPMRWGPSPPRRFPRWLARLVAGEAVVMMGTNSRGASNAKAKRELGWELRYPSWRQGFVAYAAATPSAEAQPHRAATVRHSQA